MSYLLLLLLLFNNFLREGRRVCRACATAKQQCATSEGADTIKVSQKRTEDIGEGSSSRKKQKRQEDEEAAEAEFSLVVVELWRRVERKWEESEQWQDQRWATVMTALGHITYDVWELLDGLVPEEMEEVEEMGAGTEKDVDGDMEVEENTERGGEVGR